ncbi:MAG: tRNA (guanine(10)-N(2))-dimethyltransferase [Sulfolobales archaeon]
MGLEIDIPPWAEVIAEGRARIIAPKKELFLRSDGIYEPAHAPVFYNPAMVFNRDIAIAFLNTYSRLFGRIESASDPMAATGVRGVRIALEVDGISGIILNDIDPQACKVMKLNILLNGISGLSRIYCEDANQLMISLSKSGIHVDYLDIDPYGSPAPYIESAIKFAGIGGVLAVTATDLGPLTGRYPSKAFRRYRARVDSSVDFRRELGLRVLIYSVVSKASEHDMALKPLLSYYADHYYRVYFSIDMGASKADHILARTGYIALCPSCGYREANQDIARGVRCPLCGSNMTLLGPAWLGSLADPELARGLASSVDRYTWLETRDRIKWLVSLLETEDRIDKPFFYRIDYLARRAKVNMPPREGLIECLRSMGYDASRTHFDDIGVKTNAGLEDINRCLKR